ncbi:DJ-1/PfpI family protein [Caulobacter henricii]|uniref:Thiamine biosynthesis protein ThiJ n=1 Tax=Caulobacter henricii TaxID=69395 RepID=A0A0P0P1L6_9CAUL|nr:DJ-1/PfpI family protein [Caulobacter henricii]ALL14413.1 thiamine biosynthesis protein ThiJ [Caulobacter henricii]
MAQAEPLNIVFALFPGVTHLDFTGPHQILCRLPGAKVTVACLDGGEIEADGLIFAHLPRLADVGACDVLIVPGGFGTTQAMAEPAFLAEIRRLAAGARYVCSVCTGSLVLGAAGLLKGRRAACHWAWRDQLSLFGAIPDPERVVRDGHVFTGGGVTAGIDFALTIAAEIAGEAVAQSIQLGVEYAPAPPFNAGRPETAPAEVLERVQRMYGKGMDERLAAAEKAGALL